MSGIKYIHAADLHLDSPFAGLMRENTTSRLGKLLKDATYSALDRLVQLCESQNPHFLVLAGDIYNSEYASIKAQLKLREACRRLDDLGIPVYIVHGNHDPLSSSFGSLKFPPNVHVFPGDSPEIVEFNGSDNSRALIHGISHSQNREERNLAALFHRRENDPAFQLGLLHCSVEHADKGDRFAPCTLNDLKNTGLDAWALGHVHEGGVLCDSPFIAYSGNTQGLNINETGARGCLIVQAENEGGIWRCQPEFYPLAPVLWQKTGLDLDRATDMNELEKRLGRLVEKAAEEADPSAKMIIERLIINGKTPLNAWLRQNERMEDLRSIISHHSGNRPSFWLKDVEIYTRDEEVWEQSMDREDLLGQTMRVYAKLSSDPASREKTLQATLEPLLKRPLLAKIFQDTSEADIKEMLYQAESICLDILEKH